MTRETGLAPRDVSGNRDANISKSSGLARDPRGCFRHWKWHPAGRRRAAPPVIDFQKPEPYVVQAPPLPRSSNSTHRRRRHRRRSARILGPIRRWSPWVGAFIGVMLLLSLARLISARQELNTARLRMEASRNEVLARHDDEARAALSEAGRKITGARHDLALPPIRVLSAIPLVGSPWRAAGDAAAAGKHGVAAGRVMIDAASSFPNAGGSGLAGHDVTAIHAAITKTNVALVEANAELAAADRDLAGARHAVLPVIASPARAMSGAIGDARTQLQSASRVVSLLNTLLDPAGDHRFLLLAQDTLEARPTGGFIGSLGVLPVAPGKLTLERYEDSRTLPAPDPPLDPPPDLAPSLPRYWGLSNTDWWPDFPTSASVAKEMFKRQGGGAVDGVISVTEHLLGDLVGVLGPIQLPDYDKPVVEDGFDQRVVYEVELKNPPDVPQKKFLILLAKDVLDRLFSAPPDKVPDLAKAFGGAASSGDLQIWMADPKLQNTVLQTGVSGALPRANQDF